MFIKKIEYEKETVKNREIYPHNIPCLKNFEELEFHSPVTFLVGENGTGKSTLIEALAVSLKLNAEGGSQNFNFSTKYTTSSLHDYLRVFKSGDVPQTKFFLRAESFYNFATQMDKLDEDGGGPLVKNYYGGKSLHEQSHGESFLAVMKNRFGKNGLYILDEPEAALSPTRQMSLLVLIHDLVKEGSQFIIATHSPILLAYPKAEIYDLENNFAKCKYEVTDHYQLYKMFLNNKDRVLQELLEDYEK